MARARTVALCLPSPFLRALHGCWEWSLTTQGTFGKSRIRRQTGVSEALRTTRYRDVRPGVQRLSLQGGSLLYWRQAAFRGRRVEICALASLSAIGSSGQLVSFVPTLRFAPLARCAKEDGN